MAARAWDLLAGVPPVLDRVPLAIDPGEVRAFWAYRPAPQEPVGDLAARLEAARLEVTAAMWPRLAWAAHPAIGAGPDALALADGGGFRIPGIGAHWGGVEAVIAAVVTVGAEPEARVAARAAAGDLLGAALLDCAASAAVECLAEWTNDRLCELAVAAGLRATNRISPGLAGWALAEQGELVVRCPAAAIGVVRRADNAMTPAKSISLLAGVGRAARVDHYFVQCRRCWWAGCPARRMDAVAHVDAGGETRGPAPG